MKPGDKVICIDASIEPEKSEEIRRDFEIWITKDKEYTIREILDNNGIVPGVLLDEVHNFPKFFKLINRMQEPAFAIWRFRKLNYATSSEQEVQEAELVEVAKPAISKPEKKKPASSRGTKRSLHRTIRETYFPDFNGITSN